MLTNIFDRLRRRQQGISRVSLVLYGVVWLLRKISAGLIETHYRYILIQDVPESSLLKGRTRGIVIRALTGSELVREYESDRDGAFSRPPRDRSRFQRRVERGDMCIVATRESKVEGVLWLCFSTFDESDLNCQFVVSPSHGMAWDSDLFIVEDARGGIIFAALWDGANAALRDLNYRLIATQTSAFNGPSLQAHRRMGSRRIGQMIYIWAGPVQITLSSLSPHLNFVTRAGKGPVCVIPTQGKPLAPNEPVSPEDTSPIRKNR